MTRGVIEDLAYYGSRSIYRVRSRNDRIIQVSTQNTQRSAELLLEWDDESLIDPMHLSNLLVRSIWVKDALVTRLRQDDFLSVFVFPDWARMEEDPDFRVAMDTGLRREEALRARLERAVDYAQSLAKMTPRLSKERIYVLPRKLERTPTHKIKLARELERLDLSSYV